MNWKRILIPLLVTASLGARGLVDTQVGAFSDGGTFEQVLGLGTASDRTHKLAALIIRGPDPSKEVYKPRALFFSDRHQWDQFLALWKKARRIQSSGRPKADEDSIAVGQCFNEEDEALVTVSVNGDATIEFDLMTKDKWPMLFRLRPVDFKAFDGDLKTISAYFGE